MHNLIRVIVKIETRANLDGAHDIEALAKEAMSEVNAWQRIQEDQPQEMRDMFAAAALIGSEANPSMTENFASQERQAAYCWSMSDAMMSERAKRTKARKA